MIQIIYGVPGSGKSYYAVYQINELLKKESNNILISNIENLKLPHLNLDELIQQYGGVDKFFNVECEFWKQDIERKKILFIDEAQRYFNKRFFSSTVFFFFQYHRHLNVDIYLITQSYKTLPTELTVLSELVIQAVPASFRWFKNSFKYLVKDLETFDTVEKIDIPFKKEIAELYTSALVISNSNKKLTYTQKFVLISAGLVAISLFFLVFVFPKMLYSNLSNHKSNNVASSERRSSDAVVPKKRILPASSPAPSSSSSFASSYSSPNNSYPTGYVPSLASSSSSTLQNPIYYNGNLYRLVITLTKDKSGNIQKSYSYERVPPSEYE
jgi:zona occludens toxin (predicted ATPase)